MFVVFDLATLDVKRTVNIVLNRSIGLGLIGLGPVVGSDNRTSIYTFPSGGQVQNFILKIDASTTPGITEVRVLRVATYNSSNFYRAGALSWPRRNVVYFLGPEANQFSAFDKNTDATVSSAGIPLPQDSRISNVGGLAVPEYSLLLTPSSRTVNTSVYPFLPEGGIVCAQLSHPFVPPR
eukprot:ANDGO_04640.mRNA.1 hypothetical protein